MSEETVHRTINLESQPKFLSLLCIGLLFRLAGQHTFSIQELHDINLEFDGLKIRHTTDPDNVSQGTVTVTLHRKES
jgi:hypothetical protein